MKKLVLFAVALVAISFASCKKGNTEATPSTDSVATAVDSSAATVDTTTATVDSAAAQVDSVAKK